MAKPWIYYRTHIQNIGWAPWRYNGEISGTSGLSYRLEAIQIEVAPRDTYFSINADEPAYLSLD